MEGEERKQLEDRLYNDGLALVAYTYQNALIASELVERFQQWMYLYEVILKSAASLAWARSRSQGNQPSELRFFLRDTFQQTSQGHWLQLMRDSATHLRKSGDLWGRNLDHLQAKKLAAESWLAIRKITDGLSGHSERNETKMKVGDLMATLTELRNRTQGHGAQRRSFYEEINPDFEDAVLHLLAEFEPFLKVSLLFIQGVQPSGPGSQINGLQIRGLRRSPWSGRVHATVEPQVRTLASLDELNDPPQIFSLDPLFTWDERRDAVCVYNSYTPAKQQWEYLSYAHGGPLHLRGRTFESAFNLPAGPAPTTSRGPMRFWSDKGVALYPIETPLVGQTAVFNALEKFRRKFGQTGAANFFALIGDWGLGKSRVGLEPFAQAFGHVEKWLINPDEAAPNADGRLLAAGLADGILPLWIRYDIACTDDLFAYNWIPRLAIEALRLVAEGGGQGIVPDALLADLRAALQAKGVELDFLKSALEGAGDDDARIEATLQILRQAGINHLWVIVDEVETPGDYQRRPDWESGEPLDAQYLTLAADVFRHENYHIAKPFYANLNFLLLCSEGMRDKLEIGPIRRRDDVSVLSPNRLSDARRLIEYLKEKAAQSGQSVDYPPGTVEGAFLASNRNFGWFNVLMSSIHSSYQRYLSEGRAVTAAQLIEEFTHEARARYVFDREGLDLLDGVRELPAALLREIVYGQLPVIVGEKR